ncbi:MAG: MarR family transcriptional regulator [Polyangiales bacterium]
MLHDARALYEQLGLDIEPGWHLVFLLLEARGPLSVTDITLALGVAHPSVVATTTRMIERGYLSAQPDPQDGRSRRLRLSAQGRATLEASKPIWEASRRGLDGLIAETGVDVLALVSALERCLDAKDYRDRTLNARGAPARRRAPTRRTRTDR